MPSLQNLPYHDGHLPPLHIMQTKQAAHTAKGAGGPVRKKAKAPQQAASAPSGSGDGVSTDSNW